MINYILYIAHIIQFSNLFFLSLPYSGVTRGGLREEIQIRRVEY